MKGQKRRQLVTRLIRNRKLVWTLRLSKEIIDIASKLAMAKDNPLALISAIGSIGWAATQGLSESVFDSDGLVKALDIITDQTKIGDMLWASGLLEENCDLVELTADSEGVLYEITHRSTGSKLWLRKYDESNFDIYVPREDPELCVRLASPILANSPQNGYLISRISTEYYSNRCRMMPLAPIDENLDLEQALDLANRIDLARRQRHSPSFVLWGPAGTGKTTCAQVVAEIFNDRVLVMGPDTIRSMAENQTLQHIVSVLKPGMLIFDDVDKMTSGDIWYTTINQLRASFPDLALIFTANDLKVMGPVVLRPGRAGEVIEFKTPTLEQKAKILAFDAPHLDCLRLARLLRADMTHDWVRELGRKIVQRAVKTFEEAEREVAEINLRHQIVQAGGKSEVDDED